MLKSKKGTEPIMWIIVTAVIALLVLVIINSGLGSAFLRLFKSSDSWYNQAAMESCNSDPAYANRLDSDGDGWKDPCDICTYLVTDKYTKEKYDEVLTTLKTQEGRWKDVETNTKNPTKSDQNTEHDNDPDNDKIVGICDSDPKKTISGGIGDPVKTECLNVQKAFDKSLNNYNIMMRSTYSGPGTYSVCWIRYNG